MGEPSGAFRLMPPGDASARGRDRSRGLSAPADLPIPALEVIQSTHDHYLSAAGARAAFGPDMGHHVLHAIEATSHTFVGGREALLEQLRLSLDRVAGS